MTALLTDNLPLLAGAPNGIKKLRELMDFARRALHVRVPHAVLTTAHTHINAHTST